MALRGVSRTRWYYPPYEFECPTIPHLDARLSITLSVLVGWSFGEIAPEVVLEELHTACELTLEELVNKRAKKLSFAELTEKAHIDGHLEKQWATDHDPVALLTSLKDLRKDVRHRGASGSADWLREDWEHVAILLERLVYRLDKQSMASAAKT